MSRRVLVAGVGNIFLSDDAFGVEVANHLMCRDLPVGVRVEDFGIRGMHLAYELLEGYEAAVLVDAVDLGEAPGTVVLIEPEGTDKDPDEMSLDAHSMSPDMVLATLARLGGSSDRVFVVGCQPESLEEGMGLSASVEAAVDRAVEMCIEFVLGLVGPVGREART